MQELQDMSSQILQELLIFIQQIKSLYSCHILNKVSVLLDISWLLIIHVWHPPRVCFLWPAFFISTHRSKDIDLYYAFCHSFYVMWMGTQLCIVVRGIHSVKHQTQFLYAGLFNLAHMVTKWFKPRNLWHWQSHKHDHSQRWVMKARQWTLKKWHWVAMCVQN